MFTCELTWVTCLPIGWGGTCSNTSLYPNSVVIPTTGIGPQTFNALNASTQSPRRKPSRKRYSRKPAFFPMSLNQQFTDASLRGDRCLVCLVGAGALRCVLDHDLGSRHTPRSPAQALLPLPEPDEPCFLRQKLAPQRLPCIVGSRRHGTAQIRQSALPCRHADSRRTHHSPGDSLAKSIHRDRWFFPAGYTPVPGGCCVLRHEIRSEGRRTRNDAQFRSNQSIPGVTT